MSFSFFNHAVDFFFFQAARRSNGNFLFFLSTQIFSFYMYDTISIDVECYFDLRNPTRSSWDTIQVETTQCFIICCELTFTLQYMDIYRWLVICGSREYLRFRCRDCSVTIDNTCEYATHCFDTKGQWRYVK